LYWRKGGVASEFQIGKRLVPRPVFSYEWQTQDLREREFVKVANTRLRKSGKLEI
jgi:hypothetical protein